jgi:hypothetical protein
MKTKVTLFILGLGLIFTLGCTKYPPDSERVTEDLAVITRYDTRANFNDYKTYVIPTAIIKITDHDTTNLTTSEATAVLDQIARNMDARGFVKAVAPQVPDLAINVLYYENTYVYAYYYDWWGYYPYYGYYYPYYPVYYDSYTTGTGNIELFALKDVNNNNQEIPIRWNAFIRGLLTGSHTSSDVLGAVDQAFTQTPQLKTSGK